MTRVADLTGAELDLWVARASGAKKVAGTSAGGACWFMPDGKYVDQHTTQRTFAPSMYWAQGGKIIAENAIAFAGEPGGADGNGQWLAYFSDGPDAWEGRGDTHLIAAMRAFVASKFGETVGVAS